MERAMERARMIVQQGQETAAKTREETAAKIDNAQAEKHKKRLTHVVKS